MAGAAGAAGSPALGGPAPRGTRSAPPHPAPSGGRWQHSPERAQSPGGWLGPGGQHGCGHDLLAVDLPSVHVLESLRSLFRILELHVGMALRRMRAHPFSGQVDRSNSPEGGEYLPKVESISQMCSLVTFRVSLATCTLVGLGAGLRRLLSFLSCPGGLGLEPDCRL